MSIPTYDGKWIAAVRKVLVELSEATGTVPGAPIAVEHYLRALHAEASGHRSELIIAEACRRLIANWVYPTFPKPGHIIEQIRIVRADLGFLEQIREKDRARLLEEQDLATKAAYSPEELARTQQIIASYKARTAVGAADRGASESTPNTEV